MRLCIISGGSKGLGLALCNIYTELGYKVLEFSRTAPHKYSVKTDFAFSESAAQTFEGTLKAFASELWEEIVVINNVGTLEPIGSTARKEQAAVLANIHTNITTALLFLRETTQQFQSHDCKKTLVNISSGAALKGYAGWSLYCAAKAGLENYIRAVALEQELEPHPFIAINIGPGVIDTEMQAYIRSSSQEDFPNLARFIKHKESGELRQPEHVAKAIVEISQQPNVTQGSRFDVEDFIK